MIDTKDTTPRKYFLILLGALLVTIAFILPAPSLVRMKAGDPNRYFHFTLSRLTAENGLVRKLPQVEDLGWGDQFVDKEFLYHMATTVGYRIAGDRGVIGVNLLFGLLAMLALYLLGCWYVPPLWSAAITIVLSTSCQTFYDRLCMVRPQTLAMFLFVVLIGALLRGSHRAVFIVTALFVLAYHAFIAPILMLLAFVAASLLCKTPWKNKALGGVLGAVFGILVNPYFPGSLFAGWQHILIGLGVLRDTGFQHGVESAPLDTTHYISWFPGYVVLFVAASILVGYFWSQYNHNHKDRQTLSPFGFVWIGYSGFLLMTLLSPRAWEYAVPFSIALVVVTASVVPWPKRWLATSLGIVLALNTYKTWKGRIDAVINEEPHVRERYLDTKRALEALGPESHGKKIFNCDWSASPYILYDRPDMRFVDILDFSFLYFADEARHNAKRQLLLGQFPDAYGMLRAAFNADYVLCRPVGGGDFLGQLESDPHFTRIYPTKSQLSPPNVFTLFKMKTERSPQFIKIFSVSSLQKNRYNSPTEPTPVESKQTLAFPDAIQSQLKTPMVYVDFEKINFSENRNLASTPPQNVGKSYTCALSQPSPNELARLAGTSVMGLGGGEFHRVWRNGVEIFRSRTYVPNMRLISLFVPLKKPLTATDWFDVVTCSKAHNIPFGIALSFWKMDEIREICRRKGAGDFLQDAPQDPRVAYTGVEADCMAPFVESSVLSQ